MYIGYLHDRQELGFNCLKDIHTVKQLSNLKSTLAIPELRILKKGKQTLVLLFSKEKLKGGSDELTNEEQERLVKSILAKAPQSDYSEISINKFLKKILKLIDPVISDQRFWRILSEFGKLIKSELPGPSEVGSTDIFGPYAPDKQAKIRSRGSSSIFAEALNIPNTRKLSSMQKRVQLKMAKNNFSNNLESSGLSRNHEQLSKDIQSIEKLTKLRRAQPLYPSQVLGDSFKYGGKQLERKAPRHLEDFGISTEGKL
jgi:hypothetical protein